MARFIRRSTTCAIWPRHCPFRLTVVMCWWIPGLRVLVLIQLCCRRLPRVSGLKTNRILYPQGIRTSVKDFAVHIRKEDVRLVTANGTSYWTYRYEGALNDIENAVVLLCWPEQAFGEPKAPRAFLCTDVSLETEMISSYYSKRWPIEIFFRQSKNNFGFDKYQVRSAIAFVRLWALLAWTHLYCTTGLGPPCLLGDGSRIVRKQVQLERLQVVYECGQKGIPFHVVCKQFKLA